MIRKWRGRRQGGAIFNDAGTVVITNSTFTGNTASGGGNGSGMGGGLFGRNGTLKVTNSTFSLDAAAQGGRGIYLLGDNAQFTSTINNTILGQSDTAVSDLALEAVGVGGGSSHGGTNLIRTTTFLGAPTSSAALTADPRLGPLQNNGGPTPTMALAAGSPAINAGPAAGAPGTDQRGFSRVGTPDIGAFEFHTLSQTISFDALANRTYGGADFAIRATTSSLLPVSSTASGNARGYQDPAGVWHVHITGAGSATITAHQAGNGDYATATAVVRSFTIARAASVTTTVRAGPFTYRGAPRSAVRGR